MTTTLTRLALAAGLLLGALALVAINAPQFADQSAGDNPAAEFRPHDDEVSFHSAPVIDGRQDDHA